MLSEDWTKLETTTPVLYTQGAQAWRSGKLTINVKGGAPVPRQSVWTLVSGSSKFEVRQWSWTEPLPLPSKRSTTGWSHKPQADAFFLLMAVQFETCQTRSAFG